MTRRRFFSGLAAALISINVLLGWREIGEPEWIYGDNLACVDFTYESLAEMFKKFRRLGKIKPVAGWNTQYEDAPLADCSGEFAKWAS